MEALWSGRLASLVWPVGLARWARLAAAVMVVVTFTVLSFGSPGPGVVSRPVGGGATALARLESLPLQAQSVISSALGTGASPFAARRSGAGYRMQGGGVPARFGAHGALLGARASSLSITSVAVGRGDHVHPSRATSVTAHATRVVYDRGAVSEWYSAGPLGIEQGFTVARRPTGAQSSLTVALGLGGPLRAKMSGSDVLFLARSGRVALRYGGLVATDARGRSLPASLSVRDGRLFLRVMDAGARYPVRIDPLVQPGSKLTPSDEDGDGYFGWSVALSANGTTALIGANFDNSDVGAAWVFTASGSSWTQQAKLVPSDETPPPGGPAASRPAASGPAASFFGQSVALSADGTTALIGGPSDAGGLGAAWVYAGSGSSWTEQAKLVAPTTGPGAEGAGNGYFGSSVALSSEGTLALIGGNYDSGSVGAAWVYTGSGSSWTEQSKLTAPTTGPDAEIGPAQFGSSVALSGAGTTALIGGNFDNSNVGAAWVFTGAGSAWTEQAKLVPGDETPASGAPSPASRFGFGVSLSGDGATALIGGPLDNGGIGAAWVYTGSGSSWSEQAKLLAPQDTGTALLDAESGDAYFGASVVLASGGGSALIGGYANAPDDVGNGLGATWLYTGSGSSWTETAEVTADQTTGPDGEVGDGDFGINLAMSADGTTSLIAGETDNGNAGAVWTWMPDDGFVFSPAPLVFGADASGQQVPLGSTVTKQLFITDGGFLSRHVGALTVSGANASSFSLSSDTCSGQALGAATLQCSVDVSFEAATAGTYTAQLNVPDNSPSSPHTVSLTSYAGNGTSTGITTPPGTGTIDGVVTEAGTPVAGATVYAREIEPSTGGFGTATTSSGGAYFVANLVPGDYDVTVDAPDGLTGYALVTVTAGSAATQGFTLISPPPLSDGVTVNGQGSGVPDFYQSQPVTLGFPFKIPPTGTPNTTSMFTGFGGLDVFGGSADVSNIQYQAALVLVAVRYGPDGRIAGTNAPVLAPVACGYSSAQSQACASGAGIVSPAAAASTAQAIRTILRHTDARPHQTSSATTVTDDCPEVTTTTTHAQPPPEGTITFEPNEFGGVDVTYHFGDGTTTSLLVLAQAQIPQLSADHPYANELINLLNAGLNVASPAGWWNAFIGSANALATAKGQSGAGLGQSITSALWQLSTQLISTKLGPIGKVSEEAIGTFYNYVTGHFNSTILTPTQPTTVTVDTQKIDCGSAYADPSGTVRSTSGVPLGKATVTLRRAATKAAALSPVRRGSIIMSPANRRNPDFTDALGNYGWDVLPGFYDITASHAGCTAKHGRTAVSSLLPVPPAQTGVNLQLRCPHLRRSAIAIKLTTNRPGNRFSVYDLTAQLLPRRHRAGPQGSVTFRAGSKLLGSVFLNPRSRKATFALPVLAHVSSRITATYSGDDAYKPASARVRLPKAR
jgi:hypothetical protein